MPENIRKVYPQGAWYDDSPHDRYNHVVSVLDHYISGVYDISDVNWFIKNAIISRIYLSEGVLRLGDGAWKNPRNKRLQTILSQIKQNGFATDDYIDIRKCCNKIRFEHVIPTNIVLDRLIALRRSGQLDFQKFQQIRSRQCVCLVTIDEEKALSKTYRQQMPSGANWETGNEFARYDSVGVKVHGRP